jgi:hypothetical protein
MPARFFRALSNILPLNISVSEVTELSYRLVIFRLIFGSAVLALRGWRMLLKILESLTKRFTLQMDYYDNFYYF